MAKKHSPKSQTVVTTVENTYDEKDHLIKTVETQVVTNG